MRIRWKYKNDRILALEILLRILVESRNLADLRSRHIALHRVPCVGKSKFLEASVIHSNK